jgi:hypothetical protein
MKVNYLLLLFMLFCGFIHAQKQAYNTINGNCWQYYEGGCDEPKANMIIKFNDDSLEQIIEPVNLNLATNYSRAAFSDTAGNLVFASNGWRLVNSTGEILAPKLWLDSMPHPDDSPDSTMLLVNMGPLFLDDPGDSDKAYLFYGQYKRVMNGNNQWMRADLFFTYAYLDIPSQSLINKNNIVLTDTTNSGDMQACRHANGRDWWLIKPGLRENQFYSGLLDPSGISMQIFEVDEITNRFQAGTFSQFSYDGTKYFHFTGTYTRTMFVYDFDRCNGTLSNPIIIDMTDSLMSGEHNAFALSPDGTKIYIRKSNNAPLFPQIEGLLQYDLITENYTYLASYSGAPNASPNGKTILISTSYLDENNAIIHSIGEIENPNVAGLACNLIAQKYPLANNPTYVMPSNWANFKLGALSGSPCDTLSIGFVDKEKDPVKLLVYPNPNKGKLYVQLKNQGEKANISIRSLQGALIYSSDFYLSHHINLEQLNLSSGLYFINVYVGKDVFREKFIYTK